MSTRAQALAAGLKTYQGVPCKRGHSRAHRPRSARSLARSNCLTRSEQTSEGR